MATATAIETPSFVITAEQLAEHQRDLARRQKESEASRELLFRCHDPRFAAECELRKPQYKYTVAVEWWTKELTPKGSKSKGFMEITDDDSDDGRIVVRKEKRTVVAQNESDAWALFCDAIKCWPSPRHPGMKRKFTRSKEPVASELLMTMLHDTPLSRDRG